MKAKRESSTAVLPVLALILFSFTTSPSLGQETSTFREKKLNLKTQCPVRIGCVVWVNGVVH